MRHANCSNKVRCVKYHETKVIMNIYEVPLTIKLIPMWYVISGMFRRGKIGTRFLLNSINNEIKRLFNLNKCLNSCKKIIIVIT